MNYQQQNDFRCAACPPSEKLPSFPTFKEVCEHSLRVHRVSLETAVQSSTLLPDKLAMFLCKLCTAEHKEIFLCETLVKNHLETHSAFFLKRWKEYTEIKCRICEDVIKEEAELEEHVNKLHPSDMFADINDLEENKLKCSPKSPLIQDLDSSIQERKTLSLANNLKSSPVTKKISSLKSSHPATEDSSLWDSCFQPEQLISKYFTKLAPAALAQDRSKQSDTPLTKPCIRIKPLNLLQAQAKQAPLSDHIKSSQKKVKNPIPCTVKSSPSRSINTGSKFPSQHKSRSRSPVTTNKSSKERELPPAKTWQSRRNYSYDAPTGTCFLCGLSLPKNRLPMHNTYNHQHMMFRCNVGTCRTSRKSCYLYPKGLKLHHQSYHNMNRNYHLSLSESMTGLPASMVKISCSRCSYFVLFPDTRPVLKHLWSAHRVEDHPETLLRYYCRVCERPFSSMEKVEEHGKVHLSDRSQSWADSDLDQGSTRNSFQRKSSDRNIFRLQSRSRSPSRMSRSSSSWKNRRSPSRKSRRSPSTKTRRSPSRKSRRSPSRKSRRSPSRRSRRSPSRRSRRSPIRKIRRSPSRKSRRSPSRKSRRSPSRKSRGSWSRKSRSPSWKSRRSPSRKGRQSPSRKRSCRRSRRSSSTESRTSTCTKKSRGSSSNGRSISPTGKTAQHYKYRARGWNRSEGD